MSARPEANHPTVLPASPPGTTDQAVDGDRPFRADAAGRPSTPGLASVPMSAPVGAVPRSPAAPTSPGTAAVGSASAPPKGQPSPGPNGGETDGQLGCTTAQLRRFIKSRAYVPLHELRRRFELPGTEDDVSPVVVDGRRLYVGLRPREAQLLGELLGAGDVGFELLLDPSSPLIVGVFPMRPVPRG